MSVIPQQIIKIRKKTCCKICNYMQFSIVNLQNIQLVCKGYVVTRVTNKNLGQVLYSGSIPNTYYANERERERKV